MTEHLKAHPDGDKLHFVMDRAGYEIFRRLISRAKSSPGDNPQSFKAAKDRVEGAFLAGGVVMGWSDRKGKGK